MPETLDLLILDLDGTLCRLDVSWEDVKRRLVTIASIYGVETHGHRRVLGLIEAARRHGTLEAVRAMEQELEDAELAGAQTAAVNESLIEWLDMHPGALPISVVSANCLHATMRALRRCGLDDRVTWVIGRGMARLRPDPQALQILLERHAVRPERALFVADTAADGESAARVGVPFLSVHEVGQRWALPGAVRVMGPV